MYVGKQKVEPKRKQFFIGLFILFFLWILVASIIDKSPVRMLGDGWNFMIGSTEEEWQTYKQLQIANFKKDSVITELEKAIDMMEKSRNYRQAVVDVKTENLNMRAKPQLEADVLIQLPVGSVVEVLYFDDETFRIGGEYGKWVKIKYSGQEGWVWGNYINIIK
jgi:uncharacterized protein YgiM (DUF1202 family)